MATTKYLVNIKTNSAFNQIESKSNLATNVEGSSGVNYILTNEASIITSQNTKKIQQVKQGSIQKTELESSDTKIAVKKVIDDAIANLDTNIANKNFYLFSTNIYQHDCIIPQFSEFNNTYTLIDDSGYIKKGSTSNGEYWWYFKPTKNIEFGSYYQIDFSMDLNVSALFVGGKGTDGKYPIEFLIGSGVREYNIVMSNMTQGNYDALIDNATIKFGGVEFATVIDKLGYIDGVANLRLKRSTNGVFPAFDSAILLADTYNGTLKEFVNRYELNDILDYTEPNIDNKDVYTVYLKKFNFAGIAAVDSSHRIDLTLKGSMIKKFDDVDDVLRIYADTGIVIPSNFNLKIKYLRKGEE